MLYLALVAALASQVAATSGAGAARGLKSSHPAAVQGPGPATQAANAIAAGVHGAEAKRPRHAKPKAP